MDSNLVTPNYNNGQIPKPIENDFNPNSNAPLPAQNPQNFSPPENNNQIYQPPAYPYYPNNPYPYPNRDQTYPYYPNQPYPYNPNQTPPFSYPPYPYQQNQNSLCSPRARKLAVLVASIVQLFFVIGELTILIVNRWMGIILIHIDEGAILVVSTLFFLSYFDKCKINPIVRTVITGIVGFVGFGMRGMANMQLHNIDNGFTLFSLMGIRTFILFISIPVSYLRFEPLNE